MARGQRRRGSVAPAALRWAAADARDVARIDRFPALGGRPRQPLRAALGTGGRRVERRRLLASLRRAAWWASRVAGLLQIGALAERE